MLYESISWSKIMVWYFALVGIGIALAILFLRRHYSQKTAEADNKKFCFDCNRAYPDNYVLCPK